MDAAETPSASITSRSDHNDTVLLDIALYMVYIS